ncbi:MAG: topoisomerase protein [Parcubacteria group bacterium GW2011_GWB1_44_7]|nr:MAG: topoisomerase protein [Parcubacteria group bacterium GW2011_GWB1_44_7]
MKLLIVESPAKAKTIGKYLGKDFLVRASIGHVRDLPKSNKNAVDIEGGFIPHYEIAKGKEKVVTEIAAAAQKADEIIIATDPDREGEAIAWHIAEIIKDNFSELKTKNEKRKIPLKRVVYHEITKEAIQEALAHPRAIDQNLRRAQEARRVLDRLVGYDLSGLIWKKVRYGLSAGRVQSPALRILMEREREIKAFKPETFWRIFADFNAKTGSFRANCSIEPKTLAETERILAVAKKSAWTVTNITETETRRAPRAPFTTSTIQQIASSRLGFSPSRTMRAAQKLYEAGLITYMRTDSTTLAVTALAAIAQTVKNTYGAEHHEGRQYATKSKNAQEAHEAIRPTHFERATAGYGGDEKKLYELIYHRALASQMKDARLLRTAITAGATNQTIPVFIANGSRTLYKGWLLADPAAAGEDTELPKVAKNEVLKLKEIISEEKQTEPPPRYSEAGLIKELEKRGIGRPSTYASIIDTLEKRGYTEKINRSLKPTDTGDVVSSFLEQHFANYISDSFTAEMEDSLDAIAEGKKEYEKTLANFYKPFHQEVKQKEKLEKATNLGEADEKFKCPKCAEPMEIKLGKNGRFLSCKKFPDCDGSLTMEGLEMKKLEDTPLGIDPTSGLPVLLLSGKFGPYVQIGHRMSDARNRKSEIRNPTSDIRNPKRASVPKGFDISKITLADALKFLSLPRLLGKDSIGKEITASRGRFGPYIVRDGDFRSLKAPDDVYTIILARALQILSEPKKLKRVFKTSK